MSETYYRLHWADCPEFNSDNAWSKPWGSRANPADPTQHECSCCPGDDPECRWCEGTGWMEARRGYSCLESAEELMAYMRGWAKDLVADPSVARPGDQVIVFRGQLVGRGDTDEYLVVPTEIVAQHGWAEFVASSAP